MPEDCLQLVFEMCLFLTFQQVRCYSCLKRTVETSAVIPCSCSEEGLSSGNKGTCAVDFRLFYVCDICKGAKEWKVKQLLVIKIIPAESSPKTLSFIHSG